MKHTHKQILAACAAAACMAFAAMPVFAEETAPQGYVTVAVEKFTTGEGYILEPVEVPFYEGETGTALTERALGVEQINEGEGVGAYIASIADPDGGKGTVPEVIRNAVEAAGGTLAEERLTAGWLASYDYASTAGWMYMVNNEVPSFGIGDYIVLGDCEGTVEDISFRSTRIRSPDNVAITIENSKVTAEYIQNYDRRQSRLWKFTIGLTYDTPREKIEQLTADLAAMLQAQPDVQPDGVTIALDKFNDYSIDLACRVYITKVNLREFMQVKNTLNLQILDLMREEGCEFAFPTTTVEMAEKQ